MSFIVQTLSSKVGDSYTLAYKYYHIISILNDLDLVKRDLQLLAFSASEKRSVSDVKEEFIEKFKTSEATIGNIISKLYNKGMLEKKANKYVGIVPVLYSDFDKNILLNVKVLREEKEKKEENEAGGK